MKLNKDLILVLLICGILSTIIYISADIICSVFHPNYSYVNQTISELSAIGSPTTQLWKVLTFLFSPFVIAFGLGVFFSSKKKSLKISGVLISIFGLSGYAWLFFPMNARGNIGSASDTGHLILAAITVILLVLIISFGSQAEGKKFKIYSISTLFIMLFFGFLVAMMAPNVAAQAPTPWIGIFERISVFSSLIWMSVLAIILLRKI